MELLSMGISYEAKTKHCARTLVLVTVDRYIFSNPTSFSSQTLGFVSGYIVNILYPIKTLQFASFVAELTVPFCDQCSKHVRKTQRQKANLSWVLT